MLSYVLSEGDFINVLLSVFLVLTVAVYIAKLYYGD